VQRNQKMDSKTKMEWLVKGAEVTFETAREICYREGNKGFSYAPSSKMNSESENLRRPRRYCWSRWSNFLGAVVRDPKCKMCVAALIY
jgi:hypothetical protein